MFIVEKHFCDCLSWTGPFLIEYYFHLGNTGQSNKYLIQLSYLAHTFLKIRKVSLSLQGKQPSVFAAKDKIRGSWKIRILENFHLPPMRLTASQCVKNYLMILMVILTNVMFPILYHEIWKICVTQWSNVFHRAKALYYKITHISKSHSKCKTDQCLLT